jgi:hypothetical protein
MTDKQKEFCKMLLTPTMSLEEKMDELWDLPNEELDLLMEKFKGDDEHEICNTIKNILDEKKLVKNINPDEFQFSGLE